MSPEEDKTIAPEFRYIKIDETQYWDKEFVNQLCGGRLIATYVFDATERTYCCEITPSYDMRHCGTEVVGNDFYDLPDEKRDEIYEVIMENDGPDNDHYRHCHTVKDSLPVTCNAETLEEVIEYFQSNPW